MSKQGTFVRKFKFNMLILQQINAVGFLNNVRGYQYHNSIRGTLLLTILQKALKIIFITIVYEL